MAQLARMTRQVTLAFAMLGVMLAASVAPAWGQVGTTFPADFPVILDASLGVPVIGFGAAGKIRHTPVIFLHGNNDTPFATACNPLGKIHAMAQFFLDHGYAASELWGLGYQGDQSAWVSRWRARGCAPTTRFASCAASSPSMARTTASSTAHPRR